MFPATPRKSFPDLFLILVPRHFERSREVGRELQAREIKLFVYRYRNCPRRCIIFEAANRMPAGQHYR